MQLAREALALLFLSPDELVRKAPQFLLGLLRAPMLFFRTPFEHAYADDGDNGYSEPECEARRQRTRQVLMQLALARRGCLLLCAERAVVDRFDLRRDLHDAVAPRYDLTAQKIVAIDLCRAVEEGRVRAPVLVYLAPQLAVLFGLAFAQQRLELPNHLLAFLVIGQQPRLVFRRRGGGVEQVVARQDTRQMQTRSHAPQPRLDVAIASVETVEVRVRRVGFPLRGEDRDDDESQKA